jgi:hypothetical protein
MTTNDRAWSVKPRDLARGLFFISCAAILRCGELSLEGCYRHDTAISGNEGLRLTVEEVRTNSERARRGDAEAAHNLWLYHDLWKTTVKKASTGRLNTNGSGTLGSKKAMPLERTRLAPERVSEKDREVRRC